MPTLLQQHRLAPGRARNKCLMPINGAEGAPEAPSMSESKMRNAKRKAARVNWLADVAKVIGAITLLLRTLHDIGLL